MQKLKEYLFFNPQYGNLSKNQLLFQYKKDQDNSNIIKSFSEFKKKYPNFNVSFYKNCYSDLKEKDTRSLLIHWLQYGVYNNYITNKEDFYKKYPSFDINYYKISQHLHFSQEEEENVIFHYMNIGKYSQTIISKHISYINNITIESIDSQLEKKPDKELHIAHLFVHFSIISGGGIFFKKLYDFLSNFQHTLFMHRNYANDIVDNVHIEFYNDFDDLNIILKNYSIIIDHQIYLFHDAPIYPYKTLSIIHSCIEKPLPSIYYSIHLYHDKNKWWDDSLKKINYLGVDPIRRKNNKNKKILIVGRIDAHKVPSSFLDLLIKYAPNHDYTFDFIGKIDSNYETYFTHKIHSIDNIEYKGFFSSEDMTHLYENYSIVLSPSKNEAGATVLLEGMQSGCFIIARNAGGNIETVPHSLGLVQSDHDYFTLLDNLEEYEEYITLQKKKVLLHHNQHCQFSSLKKQILTIHNSSYSSDIPHIIHYIYGLKEQTKPFPFLFYYSILSNFINKPDKVYFHYHYLPFGYWWDKIKNHLNLNYIHHTEFTLPNGVSIKHYAHKSDYLRLKILEKFGGIYYDIDVLCIRSHRHLLKYACVMGIQEKFKDEEDLYGNAVIFTKPNHPFIQKWKREFEETFHNDQWTESSLFLPTKLIYEFDVKSINKYHFYYPNYNEEHLIFGNNEIHDETIAFHFCQNYLSKYLNQYDETLIEKKPTCLFDLYIHHITHQINSTIQVENYDLVTNIKEKTIYVISEPPSLSDLHTLCMTKNLFLQDIHFFIFNQEYSLNDIENYILYYDIYDIKTFESISDTDKIEIISHYYDPCKIIIHKKEYNSNKKDTGAIWKVKEIRNYSYENFS